jgi:hypothetical protein
MSTEQPKYTVLSSSADKEVRRYEARIVAETYLEGAREKALNEAFSILARYIFGGNEPAQRIAMTSPVTQSRDSERIAMTAPVLQQQAKRGDSPGWVVQFTMPAQYSIEDLPRPTDARVRLREVPASTQAVVRFSGFASSKTLVSKEKELRDFIASEKLEPISEVVYAFYNPPFTPPPFRRNEVLIEVSPTH